MPTLTAAQRLTVRDRPATRVVMHQEWTHLLFLHWRMDADVIQEMLPRGLEVDCHEGQAWIGIVPFFMRNIRIRGLPRVPGATNFLELNLRTYVVDAHGTPGVWFFSLDANSPLAVWGARSWFRLPYHHAAMTASVADPSREVTFTSQRRGTPHEQMSRFRYRHDEPPAEAVPGSLEFFLVERYILFAQGRHGRILSGRVSHPPYRFAPAEVGEWNDHLLRQGGFDSPGRPPDHAVMSPGVVVDVFGLHPV